MQARRVILSNHKRKQSCALVVGFPEAERQAYLKGLI